MDKVFTTIGVFVLTALLFAVPILTGVSFALKWDGGICAFSCLLTATEYLLVCFAATYDTIVTG